MTTKAGVGMSNPNVAGREAAEQALQKANVERPDFVLTRSKGNGIYEMDGKPTSEVLQEYFPDRDLAKNWRIYAISCVICLRAPSYMGDEEYIVRTILSVDPTDGSATVQTEIPEDISVWLSSRDQEKVNAGLDRMADHIRQELGYNQPNLLFHFDRCSRGKMMYREQEKMRLLRQFRQAVGPEVPWVGFHTYGEIGPVNKRNCYHNQTAVVLALS